MATPRQEQCERGDVCHAAIFGMTRNCGQLLRAPSEHSPYNWQREGSTSNKPVFESTGTAASMCIPWRCNGLEDAQSILRSSAVIPPEKLKLLCSLGQRYGLRPFLRDISTTHNKGMTWRIMTSLQAVTCSQMSSRLTLASSKASTANRTYLWL